MSVNWHNAALSFAEIILFHGFHDVFYQSDVWLREKSDGILVGFVGDWDSGTDFSGPTVKLLVGDDDGLVSLGRGANAGSGRARIAVWWERII